MHITINCVANVPPPVPQGTMLASFDVPPSEGFLTCITELPCPSVDSMPVPLHTAGDDSGHRGPMAGWLASLSTQADPVVDRGLFLTLYSYRRRDAIWQPQPPSALAGEERNDGTPPHVDVCVLVIDPWSTLRRRTLQHSMRELPLPTASSARRAT